MFKRKAKVHTPESPNASKNKKQGDEPISFAYTVDEEYLEDDSDWGKPNYDKASSYTTRIRFLSFLNKIQIGLYLYIGLMLIICLMLGIVLIFATTYEVAYADDGSSLTCRIE